MEMFVEVFKWNCTFTFFFLFLYVVIELDFFVLFMWAMRPSRNQSYISMGKKIKN